MQIRRHHHVWRYYLDAWAIDGRVHCLQRDQIFAADATKLAVERDFYELNDLTESDIRFVEAMIKKAPDHIQPLHRNLLQTFAAIPELKRLADANPGQDPELEAALADAVKNTEEMLHAGIERAALPLVAAARRGDLSFLADTKSAIDFYYFLAVQWMRTKGIRETVVAAHAKVMPAPYSDISRAWNVLSHIFATNIGWSFYAGRDSSRVILLRNDTDAPLITGDQPLINTLSANDGAPPEQLELYYPLAPSLGLLLTEDTARGHAEAMTRDDVLNYNALIHAAGHHQTFATNTLPLQLLVAVDKSDISKSAVAYFEAQRKGRPSVPREANRR